MRKTILCMLLAAALVLGSACSLAEGKAADINIEDYFSSRDLSGEWKANKAVEMALTESVTIDQDGIYILSGAIDDGTVTVSAPKDAKVQLVLNNVRITSSSSAAILVESADKVFITLAESTENSLTSTSFDESSDVDAAIFARDDLILNGKGSLTVVSAGHGIVGKDDLKITGGTYHITSQGRGISANDSLRIADGDITVVSESNAIRAKNDEDTEKGYILVLGGTLDLTTNGGAENGKVHTEEFGGPSGGSSGASADEESYGKGMKTTGTILLAGGTISINAADDGIHSDTKVLIYDGAVLSVSSGDDGIHSDDVLTIEGGEVRILKSYEGLEATAVTVNGGNVSLTASDDGINSSGGNDGSGMGFNDMFANDGSSITINGGNLYVNSIGDGIDSNGNLTVNGGTVVVSGPTNSMNGALDANGTMTVTGGTVLAAGASGMAETFGSASTQVSFLASLSGTAETDIIVTDSEGNIILTGWVDKSFSCVVVSSPDLKVGETYTITSGSRSTTYTPKSVSAGRDAGSSGGPGNDQQNNSANNSRGNEPSNGNQSEQNRDGNGPSDGNQGDQNRDGEDTSGGDQGNQDWNGEGPSGGNQGDQNWDGNGPSGGSEGGAAPGGGSNP